ncbi:MAG: recombinase RecT [Deltaproteobacteria bacterium]|jgi:hypothetical protein|nr:recombinase RecT [Deltaproteobacteria bacterium]
MENEISTVVNNNKALGIFSKFGSINEIINILSGSSIIPETYKKNKGDMMIALDIAMRQNISPLMVMQNLFIIKGRPCWSSQYIISVINSCGRFTHLNFDLKDLGEKTVEYNYKNYQTGKYEKVSFKIHDFSCFAYCKEKATGETLKSPTVTIEMAVKEGWYDKEGSKWKTMPELMLTYRAASFFGKRYVAEILNGLQSHEEIIDIIEVKETEIPKLETPVLQMAQVAEPETTAEAELEKNKVAITIKKRGRPSKANETTSSIPKFIEPESKTEAKPEQGDNSDWGEE